jgi:hypothetical protein
MAGQSSVQKSRQPAASAARRLVQWLQRVLYDPPGPYTQMDLSAADELYISECLLLAAAEVIGLPTGTVCPIFIQKCPASMPKEAAIVGVEHTICAGPACIVSEAPLRHGSECSSH